MQSKLPLPYFFHLYDVASTPVVCKMKGLAFLGFRLLEHFELYQVCMCWIVLNIFWYIFWDILSQEIK